MSTESVREHLRRFGAENRIVELGKSIATVELAAAALGVEPQLIAKTLCIRLKGDDRVIVVVAKGTARLDNAEFKARFGSKARFVPRDECLDATGHPPGGVCPLGLNAGVEVYLDETLREFAVVYPAAGAVDNCVKAAPDELAQWTGGSWVAVCK